MSHQPLNEISKKTLGSYIKKASLASVNVAYGKGFALGKFDDKTHYPSIMKRIKGISKAADKLTKEDVEMTEKLITIGEVFIDEETGAEFTVKSIDESEDGNVTFSSIEDDNEILTEISKKSLLAFTKKAILSKSESDAQVENALPHKWQGMTNAEHLADCERLEAERKASDKKIKNNSKKKLVKEDGGPAAETLRPNSRPDNDPKTRYEAIAGMIGAFHTMTDDSLLALHDEMMSHIGHEADGVDPSAAAKNLASVAMRGNPTSVTTEDIGTLFDGQELSEEFKEKTTTLFEAAVNAKVFAKEEEIANAYATCLNEEIERIEANAVSEVATLSEHVETYIDYAAEEWLKENILAVESSLRTEITTDFLAGLRNLYTEHYIDIPEDKVDVVESLTEKLSLLEDRFEKLIKENKELSTTIVEGRTNELFDEVSKGLTVSEIEKLRTLCEDVKFSGDEDKYKKNVSLIRETHFKSSSKNAKLIVEDTFDVKENEDIPANMAKYVEALSRKL